MKPRGAGAQSTTVSAATLARRQAAPAVMAIVQARMSSSRLPGKVLKPILGRPMLARQIERIQNAKCLDMLLVATSISPEDDAIEALAAETGVSCFRGSLQDVLDRFYHAAASYRPVHVVRLTGDCPLTDPALIDSLVQFHVQGGYDYSSNALEPTLPDGLDVEAFRFESLRRAWQEAALGPEREHVTLFFQNHPKIFRIGCLKYSPDLSHHRWTVDQPEDYELVTRVYEALYPANPRFGFGDVLEFLHTHSELVAVNSRFPRNQACQASRADAK